MVRVGIDNAGGMRWDARMLRRNTVSSFSRQLNHGLLTRDVSRTCACIPTGARMYVVTRLVGEDLNAYASGPRE
jgi:hypothetical protein